MNTWTACVLKLLNCLICTAVKPSWTWDVMGTIRFGKRTYCSIARCGGKPVALLLNTDTKNVFFWKIDFNLVLGALYGCRCHTELWYFQIISVEVISPDNFVSVPGYVRLMFLFFGVSNKMGMCRLLLTKRMIGISVGIYKNNKFYQFVNYVPCICVVFSWIHVKNNLKII